MILVANPAVINQPLKAFPIWVIQMVGFTDKKYRHLRVTREFREFHRVFSLGDRAMGDEVISVSVALLDTEKLLR